MGLHNIVNGIRNILFILLNFFLLQKVSAQANSVSFTKAGTYTLIIPTGISSIYVSLRGASGGVCSTLPGYGGVVSATLSVKAGSTLYIYVGGQGGLAAGGFNGGGNGGSSSNGCSSGGGGGTDIRTSSANLTSRLIVGGGGGGVYGTCISYGGNGGYPTGGSASGYSTSACGGSVSQFAGGGTQTVGGVGAINTGNVGQFGYPGKFGIGGAGDSPYSGGGGGGYYGGGGGAYSGGGGGSSYCGSRCSGVTYSLGNTYGNGSVTITYNYSPTFGPTKKPSVQPTRQPSRQPTSQPTTQPSHQPTCQPSGPLSQPSCSPSFQPTKQPFVLPTRQPTSQPSSPSGQPTRQPTSKPSNPSSQPSKMPTSQPSMQPSSPTCQPSQQPTSYPTNQPLHLPTTQPTYQPVHSPTMQPTSNPSRPTCRPSRQPTKQPQCRPSQQPFNCPSNQPAKLPSQQPSQQPISHPSLKPTTIPDCPAGTFYILYPSGFQCVSCPAGYYSLPKSSACTTCPPGFYSGSTGSASCTSCPQNQYASDSGTVQCSSCPAGYVNGGTGSVSSDDCVSPVVNFVIGVFALFLCTVATFVYIIYGRLKRISFNRQYWVIRMNVRAYFLVTNLMNAVIIACKYISSFRTLYKRKREEEILAKEEWNCSYIMIRMKHILKPIAFTIAVLILAVLLISGTISYSLMQILFNALVLWRGYQSFLSPDFTYLQRATIFLDSIDISFNTRIFATIGYPFIYLFNEISNINIDLSAIKISCSGSQAPNFLLLNCIIVGLTIFIIESDANIFWMTLLKKISSKFGSLLFNRYYLFHSFCSTLSIYSLVSYLLLLLPTPMKIIQVSLGYVSLSKFFEQGGRSSSSLNCDGAISIPLDSLLAVATTILAIVILAPIIFLFGQVLVPSFKLEKEAYDQTLEVLNNAINAELSDDFNLYWATHKVSSFWRVVSALSSIDWFYLKAIFNFALRLYDRLKIFGNQFKREFDRVQTNHLTDEYSEKINKIVENEINVDRSMPILPWFYASFYINKENENFISMEKIEWRELKEQFPSFFTMVRAIQSERRKGFLSRCGHYSKGAQAAYLHFIRTSSWVPIFQWFDSAVGLQYWKRVAVNYCVFLTISLGVWTHYVTRAFCVIDKYENFFPKDSDDEDDSKLIRNYERKNQFIEYFSAYANARTVLLQLIPGMTAVAVFSVDLSVAPVFVFAQELNDKMPPLLMTVADAWELADASVRKNANDKTKQPKNWKVFLYACHFFVSYSRLITFLNVLLKDITALGIVFFTGSIIHFIQVVIIIDLFRGLFLFGYFLVLLETFFFPDEIKVDIDVDVEMTANPIMTSPPPPSAMDGPPKIVEQHQVDEKTSDDHDNDDIVVSSTHDQGPTATGGSIIGSAVNPPSNGADMLMAIRHQRRGI